MKVRLTGLLAKQATTPIRVLVACLFLHPMIIAPHEIHIHVRGNVICRNSEGEAVLTLAPHEILTLAANNWIEGRARQGQKDVDGIRSVDLTHVTLIVAMKQALTLLKRRPSKQVRSGRIKAEDSKTWMQTGPTSFQPHLQRCYAFADNAGRIGVTQA